MIDDDTLKQLLRINDELMQLCKWLNEKRDMKTSSRLIPLVDDLTHILIEAGKAKLHCCSFGQCYASRPFRDVDNVLDFQPSIVESNRTD